jgi:FMN phosphatase YigB (HAD superfamily)
MAAAASASRAARKTIVLFDVDGTLTAARKVGTADCSLGGMRFWQRVESAACVPGVLVIFAQVVTPDVLEYLANLRKHVTTGMVGGSDLAKQKEQLGEDGKVAIHAIARDTSSKLEFFCHFCHA